MPRSGGEKRKKPRRLGTPRYLRRKRWADSLAARAVLKGGALLLLAGVIVHGLERGGHVNDPASPLYNLEGRVAALFGRQAQRILVSGLKYHDARAVLQAIGVRGGGSLIGFEPERARRLLENLDWVKKAQVAIAYPNGLKIRVIEREPIALWQTEGSFYPVDAEGVAIVSLDPRRFSRLLLVTGEGANTHAAQLINHLEALSILRSRVKAAARVGNRRWNLYLASGLKVLLPEGDEDGALRRLARLISAGEVERRAVRVLDLRLADRIALLPQEEARPSPQTR